MDTLSTDTILLVWGGSIVLFLVVGLVVAILLWLILKTAREIQGGAAAIWTHGKLVANNTIQIPLFLSETLRATTAIRRRVEGIGQAAAAIAAHAEGCPGCPQCVFERSPQ